jgi:ATP-dependent Clp protease ATP-binding subunit ClpA
MEAQPRLGLVEGLPRRPLVTTRTHEVFALALRLAERLGHDDVTGVHIALGLFREGRNVALGVLHRCGAPLDALERELEAELPPHAPAHPPAGELSWTPGIEQVLAAAMLESRELGTTYYGCEHLLLALARDGTSAPARVLARHGVGYEDARRVLLEANEATPES